MPLKRGNSPEIRSANIAELVKAGHPQKQAEAIAYRVSGEDCALDMDNENWNALLGNLIKFFLEEEKEPEHRAMDAATQQALSDRIAREIDRGHAPEQAQAIAYAELGEPKQSHDESDEDRSDRFNVMDDGLKLLHKGTELAPPPEKDEDDEVEPEDVRDGPVTVFHVGE